MDIASLLPYLLTSLVVFTGVIVGLVAILMMILDHALFFFSSDEAWAATIRLTLTRCAEPLFVFVFTYLTIYLEHSMRLTRWFQ